jgi:peptidoglycan DL-endopeptidase RipA
VAVGALGTLGLVVLAEIIGQRRAASRSAPRTRVDAGTDEPDEPDEVEDDSDDEVVVEATGSNGSARRDADADDDDDSDDEVVVEATGSNGSARRDADADADADSEDEVVAEATGSNGSARRDAEAEAEVAVATSARSRTAGRGLGMPASSRSFNSARIVPDASPRAAVREGRNGSPAWGRATAPLGRRPHRRQSQAEGSNGSPPDDQRDRSKPDR